MGVRYTSPQSALLFGRIAMVSVAIFAVLLTLYLPKDIFSRVLFSWVALGAAFGPALLIKCLEDRFEWRLRGGAVLLAILAGFLTAVIFANISGPLADVIEKWASWGLGLLILWLGRQKHI
jgi:sodium/proline symporter